MSQDTGVESGNGGQPHAATVLDDRIDEHRQLLAQLHADPGIEFTDTLSAQRDTLSGVRPAVTDEIRAEPHRWAYYPWRRTVVGILGPRSFATLRLDRNRHLITDAEQHRLSRLRVGVVGLSVGHVIAHTLALQGLAGYLRLADFDELELSNLNRVPATVLDLGLNKAVIAARRVAELDPYLTVDARTEGLAAETVDDFLDGLDVVVEECDSLDIKVVVREAARARGIPVLMSTSDRGMVDVERFDLEPDRPVLHGLLQGIDSSRLAGLSNRDKIPHMLRFLDVSQASPKAAASMVEVNTTLTTWPQLAGEVILGATALVEAVRRIGLGEQLQSGRVRIDIGAALDRLAQPQPRIPTPNPTADAARLTVDTDVVQAVATAASLAPSAGNAQPWQISTADSHITVAIDPRRTSTLDIGHRASAVAVGAASFNARVAAAAHLARAEVTVDEDTPDSPLRMTITLGAGGDGAASGHDGAGHDDDLARLAEPMLERQTNRRDGPADPVDGDTLEAIAEVTRRWGARLHLLTDRGDITAAAQILGAADRVRYLTPRLHAEMLGEVRWPEDPEPALDRIDAHSLELGADDFATLDILRRPDVMAHLASWSGGIALGHSTRDRVQKSSALGVVTVQGQTLSDFARGGSATEAAWITATSRTMAVHPVSPLFLYALDDTELAGLSPEFVSELSGLRRDFRDLAGLDVDETVVLVLRLTTAAPTTGPRSQRRELRPGTESIIDL